ncbi:methyltransferase-like protein 6 isoform X4 [Arachis ipaensis]|uniref:methyltransferase-like protein 6 isoform X4 n=1 Tax=Arachis ipaensis TaxID=130454 RepID=UPI000A2B2152|nr:methyltransferase-like protein 6 isoform X4 [Arachis ipaensis]XP_020969125.1 methyltransferase-like protein 6 isoform X4 [Arachis ipaensis]
MEQQKPQQTQRLQIYPNSNNGVTPFWRGTLSYNALACKLSAQKSFFLGILFIGFYFAKKYEREAKRYWDVFYKCHKDKVGCGAENTIFPVIASYPDAFVYACDFSPRAIELVKTHEDFKESCVRAFVSDLTVDDLCKEILPSSVDIVTMIFMLSAVSPEKMPLVLQNVRKIIKPNGYVLFRDYATEDLAQERFSGKDQKFSDNFYVRACLLLFERVLDEFIQRKWFCC